MLIFPWETIIGTVIRIVMFGIGAGITIWYLLRIRYNYITDKPRFERLKEAPQWYPPWKMP
jgi:hypothetical protein